MGFTQKAASCCQNCDGAFGFSDGTYDYVVGGWTGGSTSLKTFWRSSDSGANWSAQSDFAYKFHFASATVVNNVAYVVGGDFYNFTVDGAYRKDAYKFESGSWTQISADCGIGNRCLAALVHLNGDFYLIGGQSDTTKNNVFDTVLKSTDGCANFTSLVADTKPSGFRGGLLSGAFVTYKNLIWKIGGGIYTDTSKAREYDTAIYTSPNGVDWTYRGEFRGPGRNYSQLCVYNDKIYLFGGFNDITSGSHTESPGNLSDYWTIELLSSGKIVQTYKGLCDWGSRHAHAIWTNSSGVMFFGGSGKAGGFITGECWLFTE